MSWIQKTPLNTSTDNNNHDIIKRSPLSKSTTNPTTSSSKVLVKSPDIRSTSFDSYLPTIVHIPPTSPSSSTTTTTTNNNNNNNGRLLHSSGHHPPPPPVPFKKTTLPSNNTNRLALMGSSSLSPQRNPNYRSSPSPLTPKLNSPIEKLKASNRRRGVTVAASGGDTDIEERRMVLMSYQRPRSKSVEVLNSWDYQPDDWQQPNKDDEYEKERYYYSLEEDYQYNGTASSDSSAPNSPSLQPSSLKLSGGSGSGANSPSSLTSSLSSSTSNLLKLSLNKAINDHDSSSGNDSGGGGSPRLNPINQSGGGKSPAVTPRQQPISYSPSSSSGSLNTQNKLIFEKNEDNKFSIVSGPKSQLMETLCSKNKPDLQFVYSFILSFHFFMTPIELYDFLMIKYESLPQSTQSAKISKHFEEISESIKQNVITVLLIWIDCNFQDFLDDEDLHQKLIQFSFENKSVREYIDKQDILKVNLQTLAEQMRNELLLSSPRGVNSSLSLSSSNNNSGQSERNHIFTGKDMQEWVSKHLNIGSVASELVLRKLLAMKRIGSIGGQLTGKAKILKEDSFFFAIPPPIKESYSKSFLDYHPLDIAKQLTIIEFNIFQQIKLKELYHKRWTVAKSKYENSPHIMALITQSNKVANWVSTEVVTTPHPKKRLEVLKRFITLAEHCKKINNYNTFMEIISGLNNGAVVRLKDTWKQLPSKYSNLLKSMQDFISTNENWKHYRVALKKREVPCLPYLGLFLQDLNFLEEGNSNTIQQQPQQSQSLEDGGGGGGGNNNNNNNNTTEMDEEPHINFKKMVLLSNVYKNIQFFQKHPYLSFTSNGHLQTFLDKDMVILPEKELYEFSKFIESPTNPLNKLSKKEIY